MFHSFKRWLFGTTAGRVLAALIVILAVLVFYRLFTLVMDIRGSNSQLVFQWWLGDEDSRQELVTVQRDACPGAHFILPADGFIGLLYGDNRGPYSNSQPHQGIDIFSNSDPGITPVYAAYDGYVTREDDWRSTLIQRVPSDPLETDRQIWLYYTHMADKGGSDDYIVDAFPPGTDERFVEQGTLLGYTGNYSGNALSPVWVHLHFSIIKDDGQGRYTNELDFQNSIDPSLYLGLSVNHDCLDDAGSCSFEPDCGRRIDGSITN
jgi:hypothetical protein